MLDISKEEKELIISEFLVDKQNKVNLKQKYGRKNYDLIRHWVKRTKTSGIVEKITEIKETITYNRECLCCGTTFKTKNRFKVFCCEDCQEQGVTKTVKKTVICPDCVNYWACGKFKNHMRVQKRMKDYELGTHKDSNSKCLRVYKCDGFLKENQLTEEQKELKRKSVGGKPIFFKKEV